MLYNRFDKAEQSSGIKKEALLWLAILGPLFFVCYGLTNHITSLRQDVGSYVFAWEHHIPFIPWTIVPYWSIDLLYAASFFLARSRGQLRTLALRLGLATLVSCCFFLIFPLKFSWDKPETGGLFGLLFDLLGGFDKPFNQAPSLHISLLVILWLHYTAVFSKHLKWLIHIWFTLIGISVLTTWQHHFIDVPTGLLVGVLCCWLLPQQMPFSCGWKLPSVLAKKSARTIAARYFMVALLCAFLGGLGLYWSHVALLFFCWPAVTFLLVALAYAGLGPDLTQKRGGKLSFAARALLVWWRIALWLSLKRYMRKIALQTHITENIWLGSYPYQASSRAQFTGIVDLTCEFNQPAQSNALYRQVPQLDLVPLNLEQLHCAVSYIEGLNSKGDTLVHCALGLSRSAMAVAAWLVKSGSAADIPQAVALIKSKRPEVTLQPKHLEVLERYHLEYISSLKGAKN